MGSRRKLRHLTDLTVSNVYTRQDVLGQPTSQFWYLLETQCCHGSWVTYHQSEQVHGDLDLCWDSFRKTTAETACQPCPCHSGSTDGAVQQVPAPASVSSHHSKVPEDLQSPAYSHCIGDCQLVRLTVYSTWRPPKPVRQAGAGPIRCVSTPSLDLAAADTPIYFSDQSTPGYSHPPTDITYHTAPQTEHRPPPRQEASLSSVESPTDHDAPHDATHLPSSPPVVTVTLLLKPAVDGAQLSQVGVVISVADGTEAASQAAAPTAAAFGNSDTPVPAAGHGATAGDDDGPETPADQLVSQPTVTDLVQPTLTSPLTPTPSPHSPCSDFQPEVVFQLQLSTADLVAVDMDILNQYARGVNHVVFTTVDGARCVPASATVLQGLSFVLPLPLLTYCASEALPPQLAALVGGSVRAAGSAADLRQLEGCEPPDSEAPGGLTGEQELQSQLLTRWMADTGSVIAPLGSMHSMDASTAELILAQPSAAQLVQEAAGGMAGAAGQGFMPAMMAMLFGPGSVSQRPPLSGPPTIQRPLSRTQHQRSATLDSMQPVFATMPRHRPSSPGPHLSDTSHPLPHPAAPPPPDLSPPSDTHPRSGSQSVTLPRLPLPGLASPKPSRPVSNHRRSASACAFTAMSGASTAASSPFARTAVHTAALAGFSGSRPLGAARGGGTEQVLDTVSVTSRSAVAGHSPRPTNTEGAVLPRPTDTDTVQGDSGSSTCGTVATGRQERVHDAEDLQSSTRRLMAAHRRLMSMRAARERVQQHVKQVLAAGEASLQQQQSLDSAQCDLDRETERAATTRRQAAAARRAADEAHAQLQKRLAEQQAASKQLKAAKERLVTAQTALSSPEGWGTWRAVHAEVAGRVNHLVAGLAAAYELGPRGASIRLAAGTVPPSTLPLGPSRPASPALPPLPRKRSSTPSGAQQSDGVATTGMPRHSTSHVPAGSSRSTMDLPLHRHSKSLEDVLATQPLERTMDASWWMAGMGEVAGTGDSSADDSPSSGELDDIIQRVLTGPSPASRHTSNNGTLSSTPVGGSQDGSQVHAARTLPRAHSPKGPLTDTPSLWHVNNTSQSGSILSSFAGSLWRGSASLSGGGKTGGGDGVPLCVLGLELPANLSKRSLEGTVGWGSSPDEEQRVAAALGYVAHMVDRLASYLDVPLRYPVMPAMSKSHIWDPCPLTTPTQQPAGGLLSRSLQRLLGSPVGPDDEAASAQGVTPAAWLLGGLPSGLLQGSGASQTAQQGPSKKPALTAGRADMTSAGLGNNAFAATHADGKQTGVVLPLYTDGRDRTRFAYAVYLLNKDVELLMQAHGLASLGPNQLLRNLYTLALAALAV